MDVTEQEMDVIGEEVDVIDQEISYYKKHKEEFIILHADKHIVIKGMQVIGVYQTNSEAFERTIKDHERGTFIIEHPVDIKLKSFLLKKS
jgi:hypothetical protein